MSERLAGRVLEHIWERSPLFPCVYSPLTQSMFLFRYGMGTKDIKTLNTKRSYCMWGLCTSNINCLDRNRIKYLQLVINGNIGKFEKTMIEWEAMSTDAWNCYEPDAYLINNFRGKSQICRFWLGDILSTRLVYATLSEGGESGPYVFRAVMYFGH